MYSLENTYCCHKCGNITPEMPKYQYCEECGCQDIFYIEGPQIRAYLSKGYEEQLLVKIENLIDRKLGIEREEY